MSGIKLLVFNAPQVQPIASPAVVPLNRAMLCLDCDSIFEARGPGVCPACASAAAWPLGRALNRSNKGGDNEQQ